MNENDDDVQITPQLAFIVLCDYVTNDPLGKLNLHGLFRVINIEGLPCTHNYMSALVRFVNGIGKHKLGMKIVDSNDNAIFETPEGEEMEFELENPISHADMCIRIDGITFENQGPHWIQLFLDGTKLDVEETFYVSKMDT